MSALAASLPALVFVAGVGQLILITASLAIPRVVGWREETAKLRPLTRSPTFVLNPVFVRLCWWQFWRWWDWKWWK
jgi:hypothetical protein